MNKQEKQSALDKLRDEIVARADLPLMESRLVFGEGDPDAQVMFIGEAPGFHEDQQGRPFVGRGGQLLTGEILALGWKREQVYISNIVKRRPPDNRDPLPEEIEAYKPYLARQIEIIAPKVIVPLGRFSMNYFLPYAKISRDQGKVFEISGKDAHDGKEAQAGTLIYPVFHPAAALRATAVMDEFKKSLARLPRVVSGEYLNDAAINAARAAETLSPEAAATVSKIASVAQKSKSKKEPPPQSSLFN